MAPVTVENIHQEHLQWLSEITFWQEEIRFLRKLCHATGSEVDLQDCLNQLDHHERMIRNMKSQILSHENFLRDMLLEDGMDGYGETLDHEHNRDHITHFHESFKKLKGTIYKINPRVFS